jgi:hypothetical protein
MARWDLAKLQTVNIHPFSGWSVVSSAEQERNRKAQEEAARRNLEEVLGQSFTWGPDHLGNLHFYLDGKRVGTARKDQLPSLICEAAGQLRK